MKDIFNNKYVYMLVSLVIAIWLFLSVSAPGAFSTRDSASKQFKDSATKVVTVKNMQLQPNIDSDRYFVTGYPSTVDVELTGTSSLVDTVKKTKNFTVSLDLTGMSVGKHKVEVKVTRLNNQIKAKVKPQYVTVNIQRKITRVFPIQIAFDKDQISSGYKVGRATANPDTVEVSGAKSEVDRVVQVVASVDASKSIKSNIDKEVLLQALDSEGKIVNVVLNPQTTHVSIPITTPSKKVTLKAKQTGEAADGYSYTLSLASTSAIIYGEEKALSGLNELEIPVDVSGIKKTTTETIALDKIFKKEIWDSSPKSVVVTITVTHDDTSSDNGSGIDNNTNTDGNDSSK